MPHSGFAKETSSYIKFKDGDKEYTDAEMKKLIYSIIIVFMGKHIVTPVDWKKSS